MWEVVTCEGSEEHGSGGGGGHGGDHCPSGRDLEVLGLGEHGFWDGGKDWIFAGFWEMGFMGFVGFVAENSDWGRNVAMVVVVGIDFSQICSGKKGL